MTLRMTILSCAVILLIFASSCATMIGPKVAPEMRTFEQIIEVPNQTKNEIYIKTNGWFVETFNSAESVIEFQDKEAGKIMGNYVYDYSEGLYSYKVKQTVDISIKDEKVRVVINNPFYKTTSGTRETCNNSTYNTLETEKGVERVRTEWKELTLSLDKYLQKNDEW